jgi:hypothetical protein
MLPYFRLLSITLDSINCAVVAGGGQILALVIESTTADV